jgi:hypothetical protein
MHRDNIVEKQDLGKGDNDHEDDFVVRDGISKYIFINMNNKYICLIS